MTYLFLARAIVFEGMIWFKEPAAAGRLASIGLIVAGIAGLHVAGDER